MRADDQDETVLRSIVSVHPELTAFGFGVFKERRLSEEEKAKQPAEERNRLLEPRSVDEFKRARVWLRDKPRTKHPNRRMTSYGLKHVAEKQIGYVTNGMFIAAALAEGFKVKHYDPQGPNAWFNISSRVCRPDFDADKKINSSKF